MKKQKLPEKQIQQIWHNLTKGMPEKVDYHLELINDLYEN